MNNYIYLLVLLVIAILVFTCITLLYGKKLLLMLVIGVLDSLRIFPSVTTDAQYNLNGAKVLDNPYWLVYSVYGTQAFV